MQCFEPISIRNPKGLSAADRITVPCGKCAACLQNRRGEWTNRLKIELEDATSAFFITLTYNEEHVTYCNVASLVKSDLQKFIKRLRKSIEPYKIRYYAVGEYGTITNRPHYHIILFNLPVDKIDNVRKAWTDKQGEEIGHIDVGAVTGASIHYVTKYHINKNTSPTECSHHSALCPDSLLSDISMLKNMELITETVLIERIYSKEEAEKPTPSYLQG